MQKSMEKKFLNTLVIKHGCNISHQSQNEQASMLTSTIYSQNHIYILENHGNFLSRFIINRVEYSVQ